MTLLVNISKLSSTQFENLIYDCIRSMGVRNLVWRTPGSDGGRDIEGQVIITDLVGVDKAEKWYVECKRYKQSIDWPTIWKKVAYADSQCADVFLLATNSNPSPACENEISNWNKKKRTPTIRMLRGYSLVELLSTKSHISLCHNLIEDDVRVDKQLLSLARLILGVVQAANSRFTFDLDGTMALEVAGVLSELLEQRLSDVANHGSFGSGHMCRNIKSFPEWLNASGDYSEIEEIAYLSTAASLVYFSGAMEISTVARGRSYSYSLSDPKFRVDDGSPALIAVLEWARGELEGIGGAGEKGRIIFREEGSMTENDRLSPGESFDLTLLANFVHQVVNPLNGVIGTLDNLLDGSIGETRRVQRTMAARAQLEGCVNLLQNLAFLVSSPEHLEEEDKKVVVLPQVIIEAAMYFQEEASNREITIDLEDRATQNRCRAHPELVRQVLMNIFDNCTKYTKKTTSVLVRQWIQRRTGNAMITIRNIPSYPITPDDLDKIFILGFRGSNARRAVASGTGLGMYSCKQIIEDMHRGNLEVTNDGDGLMFTIRLPNGEAG